MKPEENLYQVEIAHPAPATLGESPLWCAAEQSLYYVDINEKQVLRWHPESGDLKHWQLDSEPGCIALAEGGGLVVAQRNGLWKLDTQTGVHTQIAPAPFDSGKQRFNDGKPDAQGRFWIGSIDDARAPAAGLYRYADGAFTLVADGITTSNGLGWSPDQKQMYWSDTKAHHVYRLEFDLATGSLGSRQVFAKFPPRAPDQPLDDYAGRPDGAAVDAEGYYWVAMFEGQQLLRIAPNGQIERSLKLPVRSPTMPTFGAADLRTLFITTAGCVLKVRVEVPGLLPNIARL